MVLSSCSAAKTEPVSMSLYSSSNQKLKQKAAVLQKKLEKAKRSLSEEEKAIDRLRSQVCDAELDAIEVKVSNFEKRWKCDPVRLAQSLRKDVGVLFLEDREVLTRIIRSGPDSPRAQDLLNRILEVITQLSDYSQSTYVK
jgi:hypothetical protein